MRARSDFHRPLCLMADRITRRPFAGQCTVMKVAQEGLPIAAEIA
jgi:hypothetical protein